MMKRVKILISILMVCIITAYGIGKLGHLVRPIGTDISCEAIDTFHRMPEDSFEVIGYGSSHMWCTLDPMTLYQNYGIASYNFGCNWQQLNTTLLFLKDSLLTQSPRIALIETFLVNSYKADTNTDGEIFYTTRVTPGKARNEYLRQCFGTDKERYLSYYMPLCAFHNNWTGIEERSFEPDTRYTYDFNVTKGFLAQDFGEPITISDYILFKQLPLSGGSIELLNEIVDVCKSNNISVIFFTAPYEGEYNYSEAMQDYAEANDCIYIDLFQHLDEIGIDEKTDFADEGHLNSYGAAKVSNYFGNYLIRNYSLNDCRSDENNIFKPYVGYAMPVRR